MLHDGFHFTIGDLARLLGKSPVTLRRWEAQGFVSYPRDHGGDRKLGVQDVASVAWRAKEARRISACRCALVIDAMIALEAIEKENA